MSKIINEASPNLNVFYKVELKPNIDYIEKNNLPEVNFPLPHHKNVLTVFWYENINDGKFIEIILSKSKLESILEEINRIESMQEKVVYTR
jgi:hypothetical protein